MDYRADSSPTLSNLRSVLESVRDALPRLREATDGDVSDRRPIPSRGELDEVLATLDGSLSLRLILEAIEPLPGERVHHLATREYLAKRDGNHGDWLARMHPGRPSKTIVSHMGKDTYAFVHPLFEPRTLSIREAARNQAFPDWFTFGGLSFVDAFRVIGNAVPPLLSFQLARNVAAVLRSGDDAEVAEAKPARASCCGCLTVRPTCERHTIRAWEAPDERSRSVGQPDKRRHDGRTGRRGDPHRPALETRPGWLPINLRDEYALALQLVMQRLVEQGNSILVSAISVVDGEGGERELELGESTIDLRLQMSVASRDGCTGPNDHQPCLRGTGLSARPVGDWI